MLQQVKIALPKGRLLADTSALASAAGWELSDYTDNARLYHLTSARYPWLSAKIFQEKDIPIQVALGSFDLGVCGLDWVRELTVKYPAGNLVELLDLSFGHNSLHLAAGAGPQSQSLSDFARLDRAVSFASEYPNLAESIALARRFRRFSVYPLWGAAEIYPPENADLVLLAPLAGRSFAQAGLVSLLELMDSSAYLIANRNSLVSKDLSEIIGSLRMHVKQSPAVPSRDEKPFPAAATPKSRLTPSAIRLALPDGHAQKHVVGVLKAAAVDIADYPSDGGNRRPTIGLPNFAVKVIRPQDMPLQVANSKFDLAITGEDWVREHLYQFPSSPIRRLLDLKLSRVRIVAAVHNDLPVENIVQLREYAAQHQLRLRLASEYVTIADKYARDNHLGLYRIIPTWGATESFLPDEADVLIENTETGSTLKRHNLKIIDTLFESTAQLIANSTALGGDKSEEIRALVDRLSRGIEGG
jgi:ATP phosphoribosyltransferase